MMLQGLALIDGYRYVRIHSDYRVRSWTAPLQHLSRSSVMGSLRRGRGLSLGSMDLYARLT